MRRLYAALTRDREAPRLPAPVAALAAQAGALLGAALWYAAIAAGIGAALAARYLAGRAIAGIR
jgi:hypothetical protein